MMSYPKGNLLLQYTDDAIFFIEESLEEAKNFSRLINHFSDFSGLRINFATSAIRGFGLLHKDAQCSGAFGH